MQVWSDFGEFVAVFSLVLWTSIWISFVQLWTDFDALAWFVQSLVLILVVSDLFCHGIMRCFGVVILFPVDPSGDCIRVLCWDNKLYVVASVPYLIALCVECSNVSSDFRSSA